MSRYSLLLATMIAESGLTAKEIVAKCNEMGNGIDTTRLSKLQSGKLSAPSEKVSRDIARACNADERKLVIEGYLEKAPKEIVDTFETLKFNTALATLKLFKNNVTEEQIKSIKKALDKEPLADYIIDVLNSKNNAINLTTEGFDINSNEFTFKMEEPMAIPVKDNAMFPLIAENSKINLKLEEKYNNGDIVAIKVKKEKDIIVRSIVFNKDNVILTTLNKEFETMEYKKNDIVILGKVANIITSI